MRIQSIIAGFRAWFQSIRVENQWFEREMLIGFLFHFIFFDRSESISFSCYASIISSIGDLWLHSVLVFCRTKVSAESLIIFLKFMIQLLPLQGKPVENRSDGQYVNEFRQISLGFFVLLTVSTFSAVISLGINAGDVKKLQDAGIYTCNGLMMHTKKVIRFESSRSEDQFHELPIDSYLLFTELDWNKRIIRGKGGEDLWSCRKARGKSCDVSRNVTSSLHFVWFSSIWNLCVVWSFFFSEFRLRYREWCSAKGRLRNSNVRLVDFGAKIELDDLRRWIRFLLSFPVSASLLELIVCILRCISMFKRADSLVESRRVLWRIWTVVFLLPCFFFFSEEVDHKNYYRKPSPRRAFRR